MCPPPHTCTLFPFSLRTPRQVNLGLGMPQDAIIADRAFNSRESTNAFLG